jgi:endo-1,3-1,4-beta-glycanase ExoK
MRHRHLLAVLPALALMGQPLLAETRAPHPDTAGFFEDFSTLLRKDRWYISDGWTNGDWQDCHWSRRAVQVKDGILTLLHIPAPEGADGPPLCGEVQTNAFFHYGTFEARIRTPRQSGLNASVFTYAGPTHNSPHDEIDIEILTREPGEMTMNTYVDGQPHNGSVVPSSPSFEDEFRTVGFRWAPDGITWYLEGREVHRTAPGTVLPDHPQKLYMSFWSTTTLTDWMGEQTPRDEPLGYEIDWLAYTPLEASCLFEGSVTCQEP